MVLLCRPATVICFVEFRDFRGMDHRFLLFLGLQLVLASNAEATETAIADVRTYAEATKKAMWRDAEGEIPAGGICTTPVDPVVFGAKGGPCTGSKVTEATFAARGNARDSTVPMWPGLEK